jgi:hypothetical protein
VYHTKGKTDKKLYSQSLEHDRVSRFDVIVRRDCSETNRATEYIWFHVLATSKYADLRRRKHFIIRLAPNMEFYTEIPINALNLLLVVRSANMVRN